MLPGVQCAKKRWHNFLYHRFWEAAFNRLCKWRVENVAIKVAGRVNVPQVAGTKEARWQTITHMSQDPLPTCKYNRLNQRATKLILAKDHLWQSQCVFIQPMMKPVMQMKPASMGPIVNCSTGAIHSYRHCQNGSYLGE